MPTVFYAWQSDHDPKLCRRFIEKAAKLAIKKLNADATVQKAPSFELDQDRQGVTGHPHMASVIRKKIKNCGVFLADLTHVTKYQSHGGKGKPARTKYAQNPNVLIELGIAIRAKGFEYLILVMNDAFGSPDDLPFDLKSHGHPITYTLADASDPQQVKIARQQLTDRIAEYLKPMLAKIAAEGTAEEARKQSAIIEPRRKQFAIDRAKFEDRLRKDQYYRLHPSHGVLAVTVFPLVPPKNPVVVGRESLPMVRRLRPMGRPSSTDFQHHKESFLVHGSAPLATGKETEMLTTVELRIDGAVFAAEKTNLEDIQIDRPLVLPFLHFEIELIKSVTRYLATIRGFGVTGPMMFGLSMLQVKNYIIIPKDRPIIRGQVGEIVITDDDIVAMPCEIPPEAEKADDVAIAIQPTLDSFWRGCHQPDDPFFQDGKFNQFLTDDEW